MNSLADIKTLVFLISLSLLYFFSNVSIVDLLLSSIFRSIAVLFVAWQFTAWITSTFIRPRMSKVPSKNKVVVITGCDSGFGYLSALSLVKAGYRVFAGCLQPNADGANSLKQKANSDQLIVVGLDVTNEASVDSFVEALKKHLKEHPEELFWGLVNNAGIARLGLLEWGSMQDHYEQLFNVNLFGVIRMTRKCLPLLRANDPHTGFRIVNVNSILSRIVMQPIVSYCASKHASVAFTEGLRRELQIFGGRVISVEPNFFATDLCQLETNQRELQRQWDKSEAEVQQTYKRYDLLQSWKKALGSFLFRALIEKEPQKVADAIENGISDEQPESRMVVAFGWKKMLIFALNWAPREWVEWFMNAFEFGISLFH